MIDSMFQEIHWKMCLFNDKGKLGIKESFGWEQVILELIIVG